MTIRGVPPEFINHGLAKSGVEINRDSKTLGAQTINHDVTWVGWIPMESLWNCWFLEDRIVSQPPVLAGSLKYISLGWEGDGGHCESLGSPKWTTALGVWTCKKILVYLIHYWVRSFKILKGMRHIASSAWTALNNDLPVKVVKMHTFWDLPTSYPMESHQVPNFRSSQVVTLWAEPKSPKRPAHAKPAFFAVMKSWCAFSDGVRHSEGLPWVDRRCPISRRQEIPWADEVFAEERLG